MKVCPFYSLPSLPSGTWSVEDGRQIVRITKDIMALLGPNMVSIHVPPASNFALTTMNIQ